MSNLADLATNKVLLVDFMLVSVTALRSKVLGPLKEAYGQSPRLLTVEIHGDHVQGPALIPGKVVRYVLDAHSNSFRVSNLLSVINSREPFGN